MYAARKGLADAVKLLLGKDADVSARDECGRTALMFAARSESGEAVDTINELVNAGADVNARDNHGQTALMYAAWDVPTDAAWDGRADIARKLVEAGAVLNLKDNHDRTALMLAEQNGHSEIVDILKKKVKKEGAR